MKAIAVDSGALVWRDRPDPELGPGEVRLAVRATAVNRADLLQAKGLYAPPPGKSDVLGLEAAGTVVEVAPDVTGWAIGDRAAALLAGGGYADQVTCPAGHLLPIPDGMTDTDAAALPEVLCTAFLNLVIEAGVKTGDRVLLHAGASGVGTAAIQLCRALGASTWVTAGSAGKIARCVALGAAGGTDRHTGDFVDDVRTWTDKRGADVILDPVGGDYLDRNVRALAVGGRLVVIGLMGGRAAELDLGRLMVKRQRVIGSVLRARPDAEKTALIARLRAEVWPLVAAGQILPIVEEVVDIQAAGAAHARLATDNTVGKLVLRVAG